MSHPIPILSLHVFSCFSLRLGSHAFSLSRSSSCLRCSQLLSLTSSACRIPTWILTANCERLQLDQLVIFFVQTWKRHVGAAVIIRLAGSGKWCWNWWIWWNGILMIFGFQVFQVEMVQWWTSLAIGHRLQLLFLGSETGGLSEAYVKGHRCLNGTQSRTSVRAMVSSVYKCASLWKSRFTWQLDESVDEESFDILGMHFDNLYYYTIILRPQLRIQHRNLLVCSTKQWVLLEIPSKSTPN